MRMTCPDAWVDHKIDEKLHNRSFTRVAALSEQLDAGSLRAAYQDGQRRQRGDAVSAGKRERAKSSSLLRNEQ